ncbi:MAG: GIY-YIG nuclease family protein [Saprospiraceae bacterium]|nr:GIY-YIG nuclease family protein [Saprospiraceae bacterium]
MKYHVYILYSPSLARFYVGQTNDLKNRVREYNNGESQFTSTGIPWTLLWSTTKPSFRAAELLEEKLKNLSRVRKIKFMNKYETAIANCDLLDQLRDQIM